MKSCITCNKNSFNGGTCNSKEDYTIFPNDLDTNDCLDYTEYLPKTDDKGKRTIKITIKYKAMTDNEIKETAEIFMKMGDSLHEIMAIAINDILQIANEAETAGFSLDSYCKDIITLRSCNSIADVEIAVKKWIESDGLLLD